MAGKSTWRRAALVLVLGILPATAMADGPRFIGDWWGHWSDCPRGDYSPLHYWAPTWYFFKHWSHPVNLDQYPPGPCEPVPAGYLIEKYRCPYTAPAPTAPYADPTGYYGRPVGSGVTAPTGEQRQELPPPEKGKG
jgi:hypothetical protein